MKTVMTIGSQYYYDCKGYLCGPYIIDKITNDYVVSNISDCVLNVPISWVVIIF